MQPIDLNNVSDYPKFYFGGFWRRAGAGFIDSIILVTVFFIILFILALLFSPEYIEEQQKTNQIIAIIASAVYTIVFVKTKRATPGKMVCKLKVVKIDQSSISWIDSFLRYAPYIVLVILLSVAEISANTTLIITTNIINIIWAFGSIICLLCHRQRRTLHDLIAKTAVIKV